MISFAVPSDRSFVLISCYFALGKFSSKIFIFSFSTSFARRQKGGSYLLIKKRDMRNLHFFLQKGRSEQWYDLKPNGISCVTHKHKGSLAETWAVVLCQTQVLPCGPILQQGYDLDSGGNFNQCRTMHIECLELCSLLHTMYSLFLCLCLCCKTSQNCSRYQSVAGANDIQTIPCKCECNVNFKTIVLWAPRISHISTSPCAR